MNRTGVPEAPAPQGWILLVVDNKKLRCRVAVTSCTPVRTIRIIRRIRLRLPTWMPIDGVEHPRWRVRQAESHLLESDPTELYGAVLGKVLDRPPVSAFIADGSAVKVHLPTRLKSGA